MKILVLNGPNINMLGIREPQIYGTENFEALKTCVAEEAALLGIEAQVVQSNIEGEIIAQIQNAHGNFDGIVINPAAYTHYSIAILDALKQPVCFPRWRCIFPIYTQGRISGQNP